MRPGKSKESRKEAPKETRASKEAPKEAAKVSAVRAPKKPVENWDALQAFLQQNVLKGAKHPRSAILEDIFKASLQLVNESPGTLNLKIASTALKELRYSFKMFYPHRFTSKITMFGSARVPKDTPLYDLAKRFAAEAVKKEFLIMTGGGPGIMAAGNEGAESKGGFGLNIRLPFEQDANPFIDSQNNLIHYKYFFTRKLFLVKEASAFAFFPGGFGTFDEAFEVLTLVQTGKSNLIPIILVEPEGFGFWKLFMEFVEKALLEKGFISPPDRRLYKLFHSVEDALAHICEFYKVYHSMRFLKQGVSLRLKKPVGKKILAEIQREFASLAGKGQFIESGALPEEANEPELKDMTRLVFPFDRKDYGRLRDLIDYLNTHL
jgi:uncharacterized protein (TIGR00730 family)